MTDTPAVYLWVSNIGLLELVLLLFALLVLIGYIFKAIWYGRTMEK